MRPFTPLSNVSLSVLTGAVSIPAPCTSSIPLPTCQGAIPEGTTATCLDTSFVPTTIATTWHPTQGPLSFSPWCSPAVPLKQMWFQGLQSPHQHVVEETMRRLVRQGEQAVPFLIELLCAQLDMASIESTLAQRVNPETSPEQFHYLRMISIQNVQHLSMKALNILKVIYPNARYFMNALLHHDPRMVDRVLEVIRQIEENPAQTVPILNHIMDHEPPEFVFQFIPGSLSFLHEQHGLDMDFFILYSAISSDDPEVNDIGMMHLRALLSGQEAKLFPATIQQLRHEAFNVRLLAAELLGINHPYPQDAAAALHETFLRNRDDIIMRTTILSSLSRLGEPLSQEIKAHLIDLLQDPTRTALEDIAETIAALRCIPLTPLKQGQIHDLILNVAKQVTASGQLDSDDEESLLQILATFQVRNSINLEHILYSGTPEMTYLFSKALTKAEGLKPESIIEPVDPEHDRPVPFEHAN